VFYFGNAVGEAGDHSAHAMVNATDEVYARNHQHGPFNRATIDDIYDYNRDGLVNASDQIIARAGQTSPFDALRLISPGGDEKGGDLPRPVPLEHDVVSPAGSTLAGLDWLFTLAATDATDRPTGRTAPAVHAVDKLLATFWS
jgi:hypothetical protein